MGDTVTVLDVKQALLSGKGNLRCTEIIALLQQLGFEVRAGKSRGHKLYFHDGLPEFHSGSFNCGHGKNPEIKPAYITKIVRTIDNHEAALKKYFEGEK
jgi:hypothetical protein